jgi:ABC-type transporter Mla subunit MlaD
LKEVRNLEISSSAKVGMITVLALVILGLIYTAIGPRKAERGDIYYILFKNVENLPEGAQVNFAGKRIGKVVRIQVLPYDFPSAKIANSDKPVELANKVLVKVKITEPGQQLSYKYNYIITGNFMGDKWMQIIPTTTEEITTKDIMNPGPEDITAPGVNVEQVSIALGQTPTNLDEMLAEGKKVIDDLKETVESVNKIVLNKKFQDDVTKSVANFHEITDDLKDASKDVARLVRNVDSKVNMLSNNLNNLVLVKLSRQIDRIGDDVDVRIVRNMGNKIDLLGKHMDERIVLNLGNKIDRIGTHLDEKVILNLGKRIDQLGTHLDERVVLNLGNRLDRIGDSTEELLKGLKGDLSAIGSNMNNVTASLKRITDSSEDDIKTIVKNLKETSLALREAMDAVKKVTTDKRFSEDLLATVSHLKKTGEEISGIVADIHSITSDPQVKEDLKATVAELKQTVTNAKQFMEKAGVLVDNANGVVTDVRKVTSDPKVIDDVKGTIHNARETLEGSKKVMKKVNAIMGGQEGNLRRMDFVSFSLEQEWRSDTGATFTNGNLSLFPKGEMPMRLGVDDIGHANLLNFNIGRNYRWITPRAGVMRSQVGLGADGEFGRWMKLSVEAYDPRDVQVDVTARLHLGQNIFMMGGVRDAFDRRTSVFGAGVRF